MKRTEQQPQAGAWHLATLGLAIFLGVVVAAVAVAQANVMAPALGDMVSFKAGTEVPPPLRAKVDASRLNAAGDPGAPCVLDPVAMAQQGGSLVVEAKRFAARPSYVVHWAGARTAVGAMDCGTNANLLMGDSDLDHLAQTAGGFGVDQNRDARDLGTVPLPILAN